MVSKTLQDYKQLPYAVEILHDADGYFARIIELPGCMTDGDSVEEILEGILEAMTLWIETALEDGVPVPEPCCGPF